MNLKKILTGASALTLAAVSVASAASFTDTAGHWVSEYLDTAIEEGVINGGNVAFRPDANITRAEITKIVVNYDNGGENPTADDYVSVASLSDVKASAWYYNHINYAVSEGIAKGYADGTFKPDQAVTRAEASKMIAIALEVPSVDVTMPFSDVPSSEWFYPYVKSLYGNCVVKGRTATQFQPAASVTRAEVVKMFVKSLNPGCDTTTPTNTPMVSPTVSPTGGVVTLNPSATTRATVDVQLSAKSPAAQSVPTNAYQVPFIALDITASNDEDLMLTGLTVGHSGLGDEAEVRNVQVFEGTLPRGNSKNFTGEDNIAVLNLASDPVVIAKGTTKTIYVAADLGASSSTGAGATAGGEHLMGILSPANVQLIGKSTGALVKPTGTFPIMGSKMTVANITVGQLDLTLDTLADTTLESGITNQELARIKADATSTEDVYVRALTVEMNGNLDDGDVRNLYAEIDGVKVSNVVAQSTNDFVTFDLTSVKPEGVLIKSGSAKYIKVRGDLTGPIDNFGASITDLAVGIDELSDVVAIGAKYGFGVKKTLSYAADSLTGASSATGVASATGMYINVIGGDISFSITSEVTDIAADTDGIKFGTLKIENKAEAVEIDKAILFSLIAANGGKPSDLEKVKLVTKSGVTVLGPVDPTTTTASTASTTVTENLSTFGDDFIIGAGQTVELDIIADTKKTAPAGAQYYFGLNMDTIAVTGQSSDSTTGFTIKPSTGLLSTKLYTVKAAGVLLTAKPLENDTYVAKTQNAVVWYGTVRAANVNDVKVTRLAFQNIGTATTTDIRGYDLQAKINGTWVNVESSLASTAPNTPFTFTNLNELASKNFIVKKGEEVEVRLVADIADTVVNNNTIRIQAVDANSLTQKINADGSLGDDLKLTNTTDTDTTNNNPTSGSIYTLATNGTFAITLDTAKTPDSAMIAAGSPVAAEVGVYKLKATNEDVNVEKLTVQIAEMGAVNGISGSQLTPNATVSCSTVQTGVIPTSNTATVAVSGSTGIVYLNDTVSLTLPMAMTGVTATADTATGLTTGCSAVETILVGTTASKFTCKLAASTNVDIALAGLAALVGANADVDASYSGGVLRITEVTAGKFPSGTVVPAIVYTKADAASNGQLTTVGSTVSSVSALPQKIACNLGGTVVAGDVFAIDATSDAATTATVTVTAVAGDTPATIAAKLATALGAQATYTAGSTSITITATTPTAATTTAQANPLSIATTQVVRTSAANVTADSNAVKTVALYYIDGSPVLKKNGQPATITGLTLANTCNPTTLNIGSPTVDGCKEAFFEDLNLPVASGIDKYISVRVFTNDIQDGATVQTAMSGHIISADVLATGLKGKVVGLESGSELCVNDGITGTTCTPNDTANATSFGTQEDGENEANSNAKYYVVTNNKIIAAPGPTQPTSVNTNANLELMKIKLSDTALDSDEAALLKIVFTVAATNASLSTVAADYSVVNGQGFATPCTVAPAAATGGTVECTLTGEFINNGSEIYTLRGKVASVVATASTYSVNTQVAVNGSIPGTIADGITWQDSASGTVTGAIVNWIDLGEAGAAQGTTKIENTIRN